MPDYPALPVWADTWLADTAHLSDAEHGRYFLLLTQMWRTPGRRLPDDDAWLARKFQRPVVEVVAHLRPILKEFFVCDGRWFRHARLDALWNDSEMRRAKARHSANLRWGNGKDTCVGNAGEHAPSIANASRAPALADVAKTKVAPAKPRPAIGKGSRLPAEWPLTEELLAEADALGLTGDQARSEHAAFRDYWHAAPGAKGVKADWLATWRNWCRRAGERHAQNGNGHARQPQRFNQWVEESQHYLAQVRGRENLPPSRRASP